MGRHDLGHRRERGMTPALNQGTRTAGWRARRPEGVDGGVPGKVAWSLVGLLATGLAQWAVIVALARFGDATMLGQYALGLAVGTPVTLLASLSLRTVLVTDPTGDRTVGTYLRLRVAGMIVAVAAIALVAALIGGRGGLVVLLVGGVKALDAVGDVYHGLFQRYGRMRDVGLSMVLNSAVTVVAAATLLALTGSVVWAVLGSAAGSASGAVAYCVRAARPLRAAGPGPDRAGGLWRLAVVAFPLGAASGLASVTVNLPRYVVEHRVGTAALGVFAALAYVVLASSTFLAAVAQTLLPVMTRLVAARDRAALVALSRRLVLASVAVGGLAVVIAWALGEPLLRVVYGAEYARHADVFVVLTAASAAGAVPYFVGTALSAVRRFGHQLVSSVITLAVTAVLAYVLIPAHGLWGAAWTVLAMMVCDGGLKALLLRRALREHRWT
jgi:O-antigen/teichoic acid export membrane protein